MKGEYNVLRFQDPLIIVVYPIAHEDTSQLTSRICCGYNCCNLEYTTHEYCCIVTFYM